MHTRTQMRTLSLSRSRLAFCLAGLLLVFLASCAPASPQSPLQPTPSETAPPPAPTVPAPTATSEAPLPAGWQTYTSQRCEYALSYPAEMQVADNGAYSRLLSFTLANPDEGARNFVYVSVIDPQNQTLSEESVYNYDPAEAEILLNMQVGESQALREFSDVEAGFTYQRMPDTTLNGYAAQAYENLQPWEFPGGTKEIRYYLSRNGCTYLIGGYLDTTGSDQPGAISEELFNQIVATIQLTP